MKSLVLMWLSFARVYHAVICNSSNSSTFALLRVLWHPYILHLTILNLPIFVKWSVAMWHSHKTISVISSLNSAGNASPLVLALSHTPSHPMLNTRWYSSSIIIHQLCITLSCHRSSNRSNMQFGDFWWVEHGPKIPYECGLGPWENGERATSAKAKPMKTTPINLINDREKYVNVRRSAPNERVNQKEWNQMKNQPVFTL